MKYKVMGITGVLGMALIVMQLMAREKSVIGSIASGGAPITVGSVLIGVSRKKKASIARSDAPK